MDNIKRITLFLGHYGSGKTNVSVNFAIMLKKMGFDTAIYDLDIVNPYFRTVDGKSLLDKNGVKLVASEYAATNVDIPAMTSGNYAITTEKYMHAVVDVGGDDRGALALGRFAKDIAAENDYDLLLVVNMYRFETRDIAGAMEIKEEIETACKLKFTALVNNSNLGVETTAQTVLDSQSYMEELSKASGLPVKFTAVRRDLYEQLNKHITNLMPMDLIKYGNWQ
ncbi:MAG TPA: hypothetical protein PKY53_01555 [Clostridia bacterium]|jgi:MinD-like ATPase involved in chromosome partitioning or flagellar assembly|nr:hypothetical protein [Clostridia bacterium]